MSLFSNSTSNRRIKRGGSRRGQSLLEVSVPTARPAMERRVPLVEGGLRHRSACRNGFRREVRPEAFGLGKPHLPTFGHPREHRRVAYEEAGP